MKKALLLKPMLLLFALIAGVGSTWAQNTFVKVTNSTQVSVGSKIIFVCEDNNQAMQNDANYSGTDVTITDSKITLSATSTVCVMTVGGETDAWTFDVGTNELLSWKKNGFQINFTNGNANKWTIASDGSFTCNVSGVTDSSTRKQVRHNTNSTNKFGCYTSSTGKAVVLYVKEDASPLVSIALSGSYQTVFHQGDVFTHDGVVVTATYDNSNTADVTNSASFSSPDMTTTGNKTVTVSYTENNVTKTATYNITVNAPATLTSITLSGDYATVFTQFETFNHDGLTVTANYDDNTSKNVTNVATYSDPDMTTAGTKTVTVTYTEKNVTKEATYEITVNEYVQPTTVVINDWATLFGAAADAGADVTKQDYEGTKDNVEVKYAEATNMYSKTNDLRRYNGSALTFTAPSGYVFTEVVFEGTTSEAKAPTADTGTFDYSTKTWTGFASEFTLSRDSGKDYTKFTSATITLQPASATVNISTSGNGYGTYCSEYALDFSGSGVDAYTAAYDEAKGKVVLTKIADGIVPANTGVVLYSETTGEQDIPTTTTTNTIDVENEMVGVTVQTPVAYHPDSKYNYILQEGKFKKATGASLRANRAYLSTTYNVSSVSGAPELDLVFGDETTGIQNIERTINDNQYYTLDGRRVAEPTKGLYIVNGKKVVIK